MIYITPCCGKQVTLVETTSSNPIIVCFGCFKTYETATGWTLRDGIHYYEGKTGEGA